MKSKEEEKKKIPRFNGYTGDLALSRGGNLFTLKGGENVELLQENQKSEKAADGLIRSLAASEGLSHASPFNVFPCQNPPPQREAEGGLKEPVLHTAVVTGANTLAHPPGGKSW